MALGAGLCGFLLAYLGEDAMRNGVGEFHFG